jgi:hypothetical protein
MARRRSKRKRRAAQPRSKAQEKKQEPARDFNEPWLQQRTGLIFMAVLSLGLGGFIAWQLVPAEGVFRAILWGLGFGAALWGVFGLSLAFNTWVRRRR